MKSKKILIYGINQQAQQLYYYISKEDAGEVAAFVVDKDFYNGNNLLGLPIVCFEQIKEKFSPMEYNIIVSFGYKNMVRNRQKKILNCVNMGYHIQNFISKDARVYTDQIGSGVIIYPNTVIEPYVKIGDGNFFETSCTIAHNTIIGDFNFFSPGVTIGGDVFIGDNCFLGISSIITTGIKIESLVLIGAGVCVTKNLQKGTSLRHSEAIKLSKTPEYYI